jgi:hypothetical protein
MNLGIGLGVTNYLRVPTVALNPDDLIAALFDAGGGTFYEGAWYDPSDLTTLYQDAAGTTPVTGTGQPVGLMLDKSKGLTLGSDVVTNGTFDTDSNWDKGSHWTISGGVASSVNGSLRNLSQACLTVGKTYKVSWDQTTSSGNIMVYVGLGFPTPAITGTGTKTAICKATTNTTLYFQAQNGFTGTIDNISVRELPGNHATQSTSTARPTLQLSGSSYYLDFDGVDDSLAATFASAQAQPNTVAAGFAFDNSNAGEPVVDGTTSARHYIYKFASAPLRMFAGAAITGLSGALSGDYVALGHFNTSSSTLKVNGSAEATGNVGTQLWSGVTLGAAYNLSAHLDGRIYGFIGVNRTLDPDEITNVESYLADKTGVTLP